MANYTKNILVGVGGRDFINPSHYLSAVYGLERIMGRAVNPVRNMLNYAADHFLRHLPIVYVLHRGGPQANGQLAVRGLLFGDDVECYHRAAELSLKVNFEVLDKPVHKAVVYLDARSFTHMDRQQGHLSHPDGAGRRCGVDCARARRKGIRRGQSHRRHDPQIRLSRHSRDHGSGQSNADLAAELGAAAHLIHASSERPLHHHWCPGHLTRQEIESVGFGYGDLATMLQRYDPAKLSHGYTR